ncbi:hypothetical protein SAMN04487885_11370 [Clostridium cadaveris]|uniref:Uncharacterized protein n=2 Tax=Clostridium cadaveris TaxID=1529 RepID=A0A1I2M7C4_9CLOT|nr:hypothetical protein SAMN04487885_11370 [Clostridium cadaveris]
MAHKVIKNTQYCNIMKQGKLRDKEYTYCIEKIYVKAMRREEIRKRIKYVMCVRVIRKGKVIIKTSNKEDLKSNVQSR